MRQSRFRLWSAAVTVLASAAGVGFSPLAASSAPIGAFQVTQVLLGSSLHHTYTVSGTTQTRSETLSDPDDISQWGDDLFVGFQNGVGPQGQPSTDGNTDSTVVEFTTGGLVLGQWDVTGKTDGLSADPGVGVIATVNEDAD